MVLEDDNHHQAEDGTESTIAVAEQDYTEPKPSSSLVAAVSGLVVSTESSLSAPQETKQEINQRIQKRQKQRQTSKRHGARNQHRHKFFVKWLLETFDLKESKSRIPQDVAASGLASDSQQQLHVLDIAGGKGEVAARLTMCHQQHVVMVDPRPANIVDCYEKIVLPKIPNKWQKRLEDQRRTNSDFVTNLVGTRFRQLVTTFDTEKVVLPPASSSSGIDCTELAQAVRNATLIVGLHADGATEAIVDAALAYRKPFVVVPCCVFPNFFRTRTILVDDQPVPVRSHDQFCTYLLQKDPRFVMEELPFEGRNIAIWWNGK